VGGESANLDAHFRGSPTLRIVLDLKGAGKRAEATSEAQEAVSLASDCAKE
jgi:hypothetical protein